MGGGSMRVGSSCVTVMPSSSSSPSPSSPSSSRSGSSKLPVSLSTDNYNHVFDAVPSQLEVQDALIALQSFLRAVTSGALQHDSSILLSQGYNRLYDAYQLLQSDPSIKRLVTSLSSDKTVWNAVMNVLNRKLQHLPNSVECRRPQISDKPEVSIDVLSWILEIIKGKVMELIENFKTLMNDLFQSPKIDKAASDEQELEEKVRSSMLLSVVILLIVILARVQRL